MEPDVKKELDGILSQHANQSSNLLPILQEIQEKFGYINRDMMQAAARFLRLAESTVYGVATFYAHLRLAPEAKNTVKVCLGPACHLQGGSQVLQEVEKQLGIKLGETSENGEYSLETATCTGSCALAPTLEINGKVYGNVTADKVKQILADNK